jgi:hypothetical protein
MAIEDKIESYSVSVSRSSFRPETRVIRLRLESGGTAFIGFHESPPQNFVQFAGPATNLFLANDQFEDLYHVLQTESPVFFTALDLLGFKIGAVHTELDLAAGEPPGEGETDPQSLEALVRLAREQGAT